MHSIFMPYKGGQLLPSGPEERIAQFAKGLRGVTEALVVNCLSKFVVAE